MSKILVTYASRMGATGEIAEVIGAELRQAGYSVDVTPCAAHPDARRYAAVVIGSAVYLGRWLPDAVHVLQHQAPDLAERPTWLFQSGPCGEGARTEQVRTPRSVQRLAFGIGAALPETFGGRLDRQRASGPLSRWVATGTLAGDYRDFERVRQWARRIAAELASPVTGLDSPAWAQPVGV